MHIQSFGFRAACGRKHVRLIRPYLACDFSLKINSYTALSFDLLLSLRVHSCMYWTYNCTSSTRQLPIDEKNVGIRWRMWMIGGFGYYILHLNFIKLDTVIVLPVDLVTITWIIRGKKRHATLFQTNDVTQSISSTLFVLHVWLLPSSYSV